MELRELDKPTINMIPEDIFMEGDTVLVQYIIAKWSLELKDPGKDWILNIFLSKYFLRRFKSRNQSKISDEKENYE